MASDSDGSGGLRTPDHEVVDAWRECLNARKAFVRARSQSGDGTVRSALHSTLHAAVLDYFETLQWALRDREVSGEGPDGESFDDMWTDAPLYKTNPKTTRVAVCQACGTVAEADAAGSECSCGEGDLAETRLPVTDETGETVWHWQEGLQHLEEWYERTTTTTEEVTGFCGKRTVTKEEPLLLPVDALFRIARYLDTAADEFGILADLKIRSADPGQNPIDPKGQFNE